MITVRKAKRRRGKFANEKIYVKEEEEKKKEEEEVRGELKMTSPSESITVK